MFKWNATRRVTLVAVGAALFGAVALAAPASAHVTVNPNDAVQGGFARVAFRVPNESDAASVTKLEVFLPEDAPVASVSTMPVPGWTAAVQRRTLDQPIEVHGASVTEVASVITWTASADGAVQPGQFQEFPVSMGPLPEVDTMVFRVLQTYSDGDVARWIEPPAADGTPAEQDPAPVLKLRAAAADGADTTPSGVAVDVADSAGDGTGSDSSGGLALGLGIAALVAGLGGLALGGLAYARTRRSTG